MNPKEVNWCDMSELPDPGKTVLIHVPRDDEPVWFGFWDGRRWHYIEGLPVRSEVRHWCRVPTPPEEDWLPRSPEVLVQAEEAVALASEGALAGVS